MRSIFDNRLYFVSDVSVLVHNACPNPNGKKGGKKHQAKTNEVIESIKSRGLKYDTEYRFDTSGGYKKGDMQMLLLMILKVELWKFIRLEELPKDIRSLYLEREKLLEILENHQITMEPK